ncbi:MAG: phospholipid carrier-dependent glycosyltransferase [Deltaproteobacteria bacterium]|nr:phospholipid carrier-dependent glycosyltransferase [Deltaproteobacteria bacterium]
MKKYFPHVFIILLVMIVYWPSLSGDFIFDDNGLIKNNPYVKQLHSVSSYLAQEDGITDKTDTPGHLHTGYYRPLLNFSYYIDYKIWGMKAFGFRLTNIILHLICCLLIFQLLIALKIDRNAAFLGSLFFALHPTDTESISMIVSRNNLLVTIFSLLSFMLYVKSRQGRLVYLFTSTVFFGLALLSKENALMMLPVLFLWNRFTVTENKGLVKEIGGYLPFLFLAAAYLILRSQVIGVFTSPIPLTNFMTRLYFVPYIIASDFLLIFFPFGLHSFYVTYPGSYLGYQAIISYIFLLSMVIALWKLRKERLLIFSIAAFVVILFPVLNLVPFASPSIVTMRWLYFPLALLSVGIAYSIQILISHERIKFVGLSVLSILLLYFAVYTYTLNGTLWKNQRSFLNIEVLQFHNVLFADALAEALHSENKYHESEKLYLASLNAFPDKADTYINYSALLIDTGRPEEAKKYLNRARPLTMSTSKRCEWLNNMGVACGRLNQKQCALENLSLAVQYCPGNSGFKANLETIKASIP